MRRGVVRMGVGRGESAVMVPGTMELVEGCDGVDMAAGSEGLTSTAVAGWCEVSETMIDNRIQFP
jgi:hypothetical protein